MAVWLPKVVTATSTVPAAWAGVRTTIRVTVIEEMEAGAPPTLTTVLPGAKLVPSIVTEAPPSAAPL